MLQNIAGYLEYEDVARLGSTSRRMRQITEQEFETKQVPLVRYWAHRKLSWQSPYISLKFSVLPSEGGSNVSFSPDRNYLAYISRYGNQLKLWFIGNIFKEQGQHIPLNPPEELAHVSAYSFSPDKNSHLMVAVVNGCVKLWNLLTGTIENLEPACAVANSLAFSPDGRLLAVGHEISGVVDLWDMPSRTKLPFPPMSDKVSPLDWPIAKAIAFFQGGELLATLIESKIDRDVPHRLHIWDLKAHAIIKEIDFSKDAHEKAHFSPRGDIFAITESQRAHLWEIKKLDKPINESMYCIEGPSAFDPRTPYFLVFSHDGAVLAMAIQDIVIKQMHRTQTDAPCRLLLVGLGMPPHFQRTENY